jgi:hypothetical protein
MFNFPFSLGVVHTIYLGLPEYGWVRNKSSQNYIGHINLHFSHFTRFLRMRPFFLPFNINSDLWSFKMWRFSFYFIKSTPGLGSAWFGLDRMVSSIARPPKIYPNWDFWFENKPSGNPG